MAKKQQILVIHGGDVFPSHEAFVSHLETTRIDIDRMRYRTNWRSELQATLGGMYDVLAPHMPHRGNAPYNLWKIWFSRCLEVCDESIILLGHSLGGIFLAKYLSEHKLPMRIAGLFLVAAPYTDDEDGQLPHPWHLNEDLASVSDQTRSIHLYHSEDDPVVPVSNVLTYKRALPTAHLHFFHDRGHFTGDSFPEIIQDVRSIP